MARQAGRLGNWLEAARQVPVWAKAVAGALAVSLVASLAIVTTEGSSASKGSSSASRSTAAKTLAAGISSPLLGGPLPQSTPGVSQAHPSAAVANTGPKAVSQIAPTDRSAPDSPIIGAALGDGAKVAASVLPSGTKPNPGPSAAAMALPAETATASFARNANGSITASVANGPVHYQDTSGAWHDINLSLIQGSNVLQATSAPPSVPSIGTNSASSVVQAPLAGGAGILGFAHPGATSVGASIGESALAPVLGAGSTSTSSSAASSTGLIGSVTNALGGAVGSLVGGSSASPTSASPTNLLPGIIASATASFPDALANGESLAESLTSTGFEETVIVPALADGPSYTDKVSLPAGVSARQGSEGVEFVNSAGTVVGIFGTGLAHDSSPGGVLGYGAETPANVSLVSQVGQQTTISVSVSSSWFDDSARVFPITIDPVYSTTTAASGGYDNYVNSDNCTGAYSTQTQLRVGSPGIDHETCADPLAPYAYNPSQYSRSRAIMYFNLASITGDNHVVTNATLNLYAYVQGSSSYGYNVYALAQAPSASTDWANQPNTVGVYESDQTLSGIGAYSSINVTGLVNAWVNTDFSGTIANDGLELRAYGANGGDEYVPASFRDFYSAEKGTGYAPTLDVTYVVPPSAPTNVVATPASGSTALTWTASSSDGGACEQGGSCPGIQNYLVTAFVPGDTNAATVQVPVSCLANNPCTSTVLDGLTNGADYTFWVQAQTAFGGISDTASDTATVPAALGSAGPYPIESGALGGTQGLGVNLANGNAMLSSTDLSIAGVGLPLAITRIYNSASASSGLFGAGQTSDLGPDVALVPEPSGSVVINSADGSSEAFANQGGGAFVAPPDAQQVLTQNTSTGAYTLTDGPSGDRTYFTSAGQLSSEADNNGNSISFAYNSNGTVSSITDTQGRVITLGYSSGRIASITDPTGRTESYSYSPSGQLSSFTDGAGNPWSYGYDSSGQLDQVTDPDGHVTTIAYGSSPDQVSSVTDGAGTSLAATTTFAYYPEGSSSCPRSDDQACTVVTDPNGHPTTYYYDAAERPTMTVDANGNQTSSTWDADSNVTSVTDAMATGNTSSFTYDANDNLLSSTSPAPTAGARPVVTSDVYGGVNHYLPSASTDPQGNTDTFTYDANGNLTAVKDPTGHSSTIGVQGSTASCGARPGEVCSSTDPNGATTSYSYDSLGDQTSVSAPSPLGVARASYDSLGRLASVTDGKGQTTTYTYNGDDEVTKAAYSDGTSDVYTYDADDNLLSDAGPSGTTTYTYDALGRVISETTPDGHTSSLGYDPAGDVTSFTDAGGTVAYSYDPAGNLTGVAEPGGNCGSSPSGCTTFAYNNDDALVSATDPNGMTQSYGYDNAGRLTSQIAELSGGTNIFDQSYTYAGPAGASSALISKATNGLTGVTTTYGYDALDRLTSAQVSGGGSDYLYGYDPDGNVTSVSSDGGAVTVDHTYNTADELTDPGTTYDADGNETTAPNGLGLGYNVQSQTTSATPPGGSAYSLGYDSAGQDRLTQDGPTSLVNDLLGSAGTVSEGGVTAYFTRTPGGGLVSMRIDGQSYYYVTDYEGSVVALTNASGAEVTSYGYNPYGNLISASGTVGQPFGYAGGYFDSQSYLYHFGARYYDPAYEDWTQLDPSGASPGYSYAGDDPVNITDASGECFLGVCPLRFVRHHWKAILIGAAGVALTGFTGGASDEAAEALIAEEAAEGVAAETGAVDAADASSVEKAITSLDAGRSAGVYTVSSPEELQALYDDLSAGGTRLSNSYPGETVRLPDGTTVGIRETSTSGGPTIDVVLSDGTRLKVHVSP